MKPYLTPDNIRTLACVGYLSLQRPNYRIIAKRYEDDGETMVFALQCNASKAIITKTAAQISNDTHLLTALDAKDAHQIGYVLASEQIQQEKWLVQRLKTLQ